MNLRLSIVTTALLALTVPGVAEVKSGLQVGEQVPAYNPKHVAGPDAGTNTCPV